MTQQSSNNGTESLTARKIAPARKRGLLGQVEHPEVGQKGCPQKILRGNWHACVW